VFRLPQAEALINRMGFNNQGLDHFVARVRATQTFPAAGGVLGLNIGKNAATPIERALDDYLLGLRAVYPLLVERAGYVAINISSPNTKNLRSLQGGDELTHLLRGLRDERRRLEDSQGKAVPMAVKIAPDLANADLPRVADALVEHGADAVIATNTTLARDPVAGLPHAQEAGGLSGAPLRARATEVVARLAKHLRGADAVEKLQAGASLVQVYTGLIYRGPALVGECRRAILDWRTRASDQAPHAARGSKAGARQA